MGESFPPTAVFTKRSVSRPTSPPMTELGRYRTWKSFTFIRRVLPRMRRKHKPQKDDTGASAALLVGGVDRAVVVALHAQTPVQFGTDMGLVVLGPPPPPPPRGSPLMGRVDKTT